MSPHESYLELVDQLHAAREVERRAVARMRGCRAGTPEGTRWWQLADAAGRRADELRRAVRNHPDAPPAG